MKQLKFGWAEIDITPREKIALDGEFFERVTNVVETPISVTAFAIERGEEQCIICSCDLVEIYANLTQEVRRRISDTTIKKECIIINASHTHNSYTYTHENGFTNLTGSSLDVIKNFIPNGCEYIPEENDASALSPEVAFEFLVRKIVIACETAWKNKKTGYFTNAFGRAAVGMNRRVCYADGSAKMWGDVDKYNFVSLEGGNDNGLELLFVFDSDKKMTGIIANIACPSQVMEQRSVISSDFWGKAKILLREKFGNELKILPLCSAAGDQCPRDLIRWVEPETPIKDPNVIRNNPKKRNADPSMFDVNGTWKIGKRIATEIENVIQDGFDLCNDAVFTHKINNLQLPLRKVSIKEYRTAKKIIKLFFKKRKNVNYVDTADLHVHAGTILRYNCQRKLKFIDVETHCIRLGDVAIWSNPFELFLDYANVIRARSEAKQTFIIQLACDCLGYLPTEKAEKGGHYSAYISSGVTGHEGGKILTEEAVKTIYELFVNDMNLGEVK